MASGCFSWDTELNSLSECVKLSWKANNKKCWPVFLFLPLYHGINVQNLCPIWDLFLSILTSSIIQVHLGTGPKRTKTAFAAAVAHPEGSPGCGRLRLWEHRASHATAGGALHQLELWSLQLHTAQHLLCGWVKTGPRGSSCLCQEVLTLQTCIVSLKREKVEMEAPSSWTGDSEMHLGCSLGSNYRAGCSPRSCRYV